MFVVMLLFVTIATVWENGYSCCYSIFWIEIMLLNLPDGSTLH